MRAAIERLVVYAYARRFLLLSGLVLSAGSVPLPAAAQTGYPSKPVTFVVPFPPGGTADTAARPLANALNQILKQPVVVFNRAGAGGAIGTGVVAKAEPDGYTVLLGLSSLATTPEADRLNGRKPMYEMAQLLPVARLSADPLLVVVREDSPHPTLKDLLEDARKRPGKITFASSGTYRPNHVGMEMLAHAAGVKVLTVPYAGGGLTLTALLGGQVDFTLMAPSVAAATPQTIVDVLRDAVRNAVQDHRFVDTMNAAEMPPAYVDEQEFRSFVASDAARLVTAVRRIGKLD